MRKRFIRDDELIEMHRAGKLQKDIAEYFKVSPVAVSKRLKRLLPAPATILDKYGLTEKERSFVIEKAKGRSSTESALRSYDARSRDTAKVIGSQLMDKPTVKMAIDELMDVHGIGRSYRVGKLKEHIDNRDPNVSLKALSESWKLDGSYAPDKHAHQIIAFTHVDLEESNRPERDED